MRRYDFAQPAREDLKAIREYLQVAPRTSQTKILAKLRAGFWQAADFPASGLLEQDFSTEAGGLIRSILTKPYRIFYRADALPIVIVAILHGARDIPSILRERQYPHP